MCALGSKCGFLNLPFIYTHMYGCVYIHITCMFIHMMHVYMYIYIYMFFYIYDVNIAVHIHMYVCTCIYVSCRSHARTKQNNTKLVYRQEKELRELDAKVAESTAEEAAAITVQRQTLDNIVKVCVSVCVYVFKWLQF
jgi:hypothetical protein